MSVLDDMLQVSDKKGFLTARKLACHEGVFGGGSSGAAMWGALQVAEQAKAGETVLTILPDTGFRYLSKFYQDEWMREHRFTDNSD